MFFMSTTFIDFRMKKSTSGYYDLVVSNGDFETISGFDNAILLSLFCEKRADESEISPPQKRRGCIGNEMLDISNFEFGSKLWLLEMARLVQNTVNKAVDFAIKALQWFIDDGYSERITVTGSIKDNSIILIITFYNKNDIIKKIGVDIWRNTFVDVDENDL